MSGLMEMVLAAVPLLILLASLLLGHYPGAEAIVRLAERIARGGRSKPSTSELRPAPPRFHAASGGLLIAFRLAQRPPPFSA
jgi:hypothetical protein